MHRLFVYGTLMPGAANHHIVQEIPGVWQRASMRGTYIEDAAYGCPGVIPYGSSQGAATGLNEVVPGHLLSSESLPAFWQMLDEFEGPAYQRVPIQVSAEGGKRLHANVYAIV